MNFTSLPPEVKELIFSFLSPEDLYSCLSVCREWRLLSNSERVWRKALLRSKLDLQETDEEEIQDQSICKHAVLWKHHSKTCAGWSSDSFRTELIPYETSEELTCYRIFVFKDKMAVISNKIQYLSFSKGKTVRELITLPFVPHAVIMNNKYIICSIGNIVLVYRKELVFKMYCAVALTSNLSLVIKTEKLKSFIERKKRFGPYIKAEGLVSEYLWVTCLDNDYRSLYVINLKSLDVKDLRLNAKMIYVTKHNVLVSTLERIYIFNFDSSLRFTFSPEPGFCTVRATDQYVVSISAVLGPEKVKVWTASGELLWVLEEACHQFHLDPTRHLLYYCSGSKECKLSARSLSTGALAWSCLIPDINASEVDDLFLICDKFLIVDVYVDSSSPTFHYGFIFDLDARELLYKTVLKGFTMHVSDYLWVQKRQNDIIVNVY